MFLTDPSKGLPTTHYPRTPVPCILAMASTSSVTYLQDFKNLLCSWVELLSIFMHVDQVNIVAHIFMDVMGHTPQQHVPATDTSFSTHTGNSQLTHTQLAT